jgi:hypothetical protein
MQIENLDTILFWRKNHKYYKVFFQKTLFGTFDVICDWGVWGVSKLGNYKVIPCQSTEEIIEVVQYIEKRRKYRGYERVN